MEYMHYLRFVQRWLWLIIIMSVSLALGAGILSLGQQVKYESRITILVSQQRLNDRANLNIQDLVTSERRAITYSMLLTKRSVMLGVIENLNLKTDPGVLASRITADFLRETELIDMAVRDTDPERAAAIANEVVSVFNAQEAELLDNPYAATLPSLHAVEPARPGSKVPSDLNRNVLLAAVVGMLLAAAIGLISEHVDDRIRNIDRIIGTIGLAPLTVIDRIGDQGTSSLITAPRARSSSVEAFRMFRAHIDMAQIDKPIRSLAVVSAEPGDGKSTIAANIAIAIAQTSKRVILVDGNLRDPILHTLFGLERGYGLADLLDQDNTRTLVDLLVPTAVENLRLLTGGQEVPNPSALLGGAQLGKVLQDIGAEADLIVVDMSDLLGAVDASLLLQATDCVALVVRRGHSRASRLRQAYTHLERLQVALLGVILNNARSQILHLPGVKGGGGGSRSRLASSKLMRYTTNQNLASVAAVISPAPDQPPVAE